MQREKIESIKRYWHDNIKPCTLRELTLKYRKTFLVLAGIFGIGLAHGMHRFFPYIYDTSNPVLHSSLTILALGLPTFFALWLFRTYDVQRQIDKTEENTNNSTFFECARMLVEATQQGGETEKKSLSAKIALEQLAYLRRETSLDKKRIDLLTQGLDLSDLDLKYADLSGLNLSRTKLSDAHLEKANLRGTSLNDTDLTHAYLQGTNLSNFTDDFKYKSKWHLAIYDRDSNFYGTWLESVKARGEAGMLPEELVEQK